MPRKGEISTNEKTVDGKADMLNAETARKHYTDMYIQNHTLR